MSRRAATFLVSGLLLVVLVVVAFSIHVPYATLSPGPVDDVLGAVPGQATPFISISGHRTYPVSGHLALTAVEVSEPGGVSLLDAISAWWSSDEAVVPDILIYPPNQSAAQDQQQQLQEMTQSQQQAVAAALHLLHVSAIVSVAAVTPKFPAAGVLRVGDVLLAVDGHPVADQAMLRALISARRPGQSVLLTVRRYGAVFQTRLRTAPADPTDPVAVIGVVPQSHYPFTVNIAESGIGGPSAGLMFALGIYAKLSPVSITAGRFIAGTGTIDDQGNVGPIGGVQQKVVSAARAGATVFLTPAGDCAGARQAAPKGILLVRVQTLSGALAALRTLAAGSTRVPSC